MPSESSGSVRVFSPAYSREELIGWLRERLPTLCAVLPVVRVVLFGSWATGRATAFSDIDLLVVYADPPVADAYQRVRRAVPRRDLEPHVYSASEADALADTIGRMTRQGVSIL